MKISDYVTMKLSWLSTTVDLPFADDVLSWLRRKWYCTVWLFPRVVMRSHNPYPWKSTFYRLFLLNVTILMPSTPTVTNFPFSIFTWYMSRQPMPSFPFLLVSTIYALPPPSPSYMFHPLSAAFYYRYSNTLPFPCYMFHILRSHSLLYINSSLVRVAL